MLGGAKFCEGIKEKIQMFFQLKKWVRNYEKDYLLLLLSLFVLPFSFDLFKIIMTLGFFFSIVLIWKNKNLEMCLNLIDFLILLFLGWSFFVTLLSTSGSIGMFVHSGLIPILFYFWISQRDFNEKEKFLVLQVFWLGAATVAIVGIWEVVAGIGEVDSEWVDSARFPLLMNRMSGPLKNPNLLAGYLSMVIAFWSGYRLYRPTNRDGIIGSIGLIVLALCLLLTYSRGAWLSLFSILFAIGILARRGRYLLFGLVSLVAVVILSEPSVAERVRSIFHPHLESSSALRIAIWDSTLYIIRDYWFTGIGWGAFPFVYPAYDYFLGANQTTIYHAHNLFLQFLAEVGVIGFLIWTTITGIVLWNLWKKINQHNALALGLCASLGVVLFCGLTDDLLYNPQLMTFFWFLIGLAQINERNRLEIEGIE